MLEQFSEVWGLDFEFESPVSEPPRPVCMVARELRSGACIRMFREDLLACGTPPYSVGSDSLIVAYAASAEMANHLELNWPLPENILDLFAEFRNLLNGACSINGFGLLGALAHFKLDPMPAVQKEAMRSLSLRGGPWSPQERRILLDYCQGDVDAVLSLLRRMLPLIDLPRALLRGRYSKAVARMERAGVPLNSHTLAELRNSWPRIRNQVVHEADADFGVYEDCHFRQDLFRRWLSKNQIEWPTYAREHTPGKSPSNTYLKLDKTTFKTMAASYAVVEPLRQLRNMLSQLKALKLRVGADGRSRTSLKPFASKTGRNQPSTTGFIFGLSKWSRNLIRPEPGHSLAYIDWEQQEFGIAAALSGDRAMLEAYRSGDPYLAFAKLAGAVPPDGTGKSHPALREVYKQCVLAVQYCMGAKSFALRIGSTEDRALELLGMHRRAFQAFWTWSDACVDYAFLHGELHTAFGWRMNVSAKTLERTIRNFLMQANGAEMMRLACCFATERGINVCCPVHDALLIEAPTDVIKDAEDVTIAAMAEASRLVLNGFTLRTESTVIHPGEHLSAGRGQALWEKLVRHLHQENQDDSFPAPRGISGPPLSAIEETPCHG